MEHPPSLARWGVGVPAEFSWNRRHRLTVRRGRHEGVACRGRCDRTCGSGVGWTGASKRRCRSNECEGN
eukprot:scaffold68_cov340-Pavlova_lutheri.AAC.4